MDVDFFQSGPGLAVVAAVTFGVGWLLFGADSRIEDRRRRAIDLSNKLSKLGFQRLPKLFADYGIGDYSGFLKGVHELHDIIADAGTREAELAHVFQLLLEEKLKDPTKLAVLKQLVDKAQEALASGNPLALSGDLAKQLMEVVKSGEIGGDLAAIFDKPEVKGFIAQLGDGLQTFLTKDTPPATPAPASA